MIQKERWWRLVEGPENLLKRITLDPTLIISQQLEDFVSKNTLRFFNITDVSFNSLKKCWKEGEGYVNGRHIVRSMSGINDKAEREVALMEEYIELYTNNVQQK